MTWAYFSSKLLLLDLSEENLSYFFSCLPSISHLNKHVLAHMHLPVSRDNAITSQLIRQYTINTYFVALSKKLLNCTI